MHLISILPPTITEQVIATLFLHLLSVCFSGRLCGAGKSHQRQRESALIHHFKKIVRRTIRLSGYDIRKMHQDLRMAPAGTDEVLDTFDLTRIQYACGPKFLKDWVNVDWYPVGIMKERFGLPPGHVYYQADLSRRQPFADNSFSHAFAEDFIEHLSQQDSIIFLSECLRILKKGGVLRLSFPSLEGVLKRHFSVPEHSELLRGVRDAYEHYEHVHFFSREELELVARHLGFSRIQFTAFGCSDHDALRGLETREQQQDLNIYVELTK